MNAEYTFRVRLSAQVFEKTGPCPARLFLSFAVSQPRTLDAVILANGRLYPTCSKFSTARVTGCNVHSQKHERWSRSHRRERENDQQYVKIAVISVIFVTFVGRRTKPQTCIAPPCYDWRSTQGRQEELQELKKKTRMVFILIWKLDEHFQFVKLRRGLCNITSNKAKVEKEDIKGENWRTGTPRLLNGWETLHPSSRSLPIPACSAPSEIRPYGDGQYSQADENDEATDESALFRTETVYPDYRILGSVRTCLWNKYILRRWSHAGTPPIHTEGFCKCYKQPHVCGRLFIFILRIRVQTTNKF